MSENNHATVHRASENGDATERRDLEQLQTERDHLVNTVEALQGRELELSRELIRYQRAELEQLREAVREG